jgi:hypothetical protein
VSGIVTATVTFGRVLAPALSRPALVEGKTNRCWMSTGRKR